MALYVSDSDRLRQAVILEQPGAMPRLYGAPKFADSVRIIHGSPVLPGPSGAFTKHPRTEQVIKSYMAFASL